MIERYAFRMAFRRLAEPLTILLVAGIVLVLDQLSKRAVLEHHGEKILIPGWLAIAPQLNPHGAFGLFGSNTTLLIAMAVLVLVIFWLSFRDAARRSLVVRIAFGMIIGGAIGNIVDRIRYGYVIDFIDFNRFPTIWRYTFNVADACITTGVILLILASLAASRRRA